MKPTIYTRIDERDTAYCNAWLEKDKKEIYAGYSAIATWEQVVFAFYAWAEETIENDVADDAALCAFFDSKDHMHALWVIAEDGELGYEDSDLILMIEDQFEAFAS